MEFRILLLSVLYAQQQHIESDTSLAT